MNNKISPNDGRHRNVFRRFEILKWQHFVNNEILHERKMQINIEVKETIYIYKNGDLITPLLHSECL